MVCKDRYAFNMLSNLKKVYNSKTTTIPDFTANMHLCTVVYNNSSILKSDLQKNKNHNMYICTLFLEVLEILCSLQTVPYYSQK